MNPITKMKLKKLIEHEIPYYERYDGALKLFEDYVLVCDKTTSREVYYDSFKTINPKEVSNVLLMAYISLPYKKRMRNESDNKN